MNFPRTAFSAVASFFVFLSIGCSLGTPATSPAKDTIATGIRGYSYGGPNPILGSTVSVFTTGYSASGGTVYPQGATADGYGVATLRQTTTSGSADGSFNFPGGYTCPAHQFAYLTSSGGITGSYSTGSGAAATSVIGVLTSAALNVSGTGYTGTPTVAVSAPDVAGGALATIAATLNPTPISAITLTSAGSGYTSAPAVTISGGGGSGATASTTITPTSVGSATITSQGEGYTAGTVSVTFSDPQTPGVTATGTANVEDIFVTSITITNSGSGYTSAPTITINGPLSGGIQINATATANLNGTSLASLTLNAAGSGYTGTPTIAIAGNATASITLAPTTVASLALTSHGFGYLTTPTITISGAGGTTGTGTATVDPTQVGGFTGLTSGSGFSNTPTVVISAPSSGTTATAKAIVSSGTVTGLTLTNPGSGYTSAPSVTIADPGGNISAVLVAALGRCEDLYADTNGGGYVGPYIYINELSTTAAAYALGGFAGQLIGSGTSAILPIGAPVTNNSTYMVGGISTGCVAGHPASCTTTQAAGLAHAFLNAANIVNVFSSGAAPNPSANTTVVGNTQTPAPIMPTQLINTLANSMVACVNSGGNLAPGCTTYLAGGGPSGTPATDVFSAMKYIANNPRLLGAGATVTQIVNNCASGPNCLYLPNLGASIPNDLALAVVYPLGYGKNTVAGISTGISSTLAVATDINDVAYATNAVTTSSGNVFAISSSGLLQSFTPDGTANAYRVPNAVAIDAANNVFVGSGYLSNTSNPVVEYAAPGGALPTTANAGTVTTFTYTNSAGIVAPNTSIGYVRGGVTGTSGTAGSMAVDRTGNLWFTTSGSIANLWQLPAGATAAVNIGPVGSIAYAVAVDPYQNIWASGSSAAYILTNTAATLAAAPTYAFVNNVATSKLALATILNSFAFGTQTAAGTTPSFFAFSPSSAINVYIQKPVLAAAGIPAITSDGRVTVASSDDSASLAPEVDGANTLWTASARSPGAFGLVYRPANTANTPNYGTTSSHITGCYFTTVCTNLFATHAPQSIAIDSTGSIWIGIGASSPLVQFIGAAAPTWPLVSLGTPAVKP